MTAQAYLSVLMLGGSAAMIAATLFGLNRSLVRAGWTDGERASVMRASAIILVGWFAAAAGLAWIGAFEGAPDSLPTIQFGILIPIVLGALLFWRSETASRIIDAVPQQWLIGLHVLRVLGATFLVLYAAGRMPVLFALPAGLGDLLVTGLAPFVAWLHARDPRSSAGLIATWNILGITDFVVAAAAGFATGPSPLQLTAFDNPNVLMAQFPLVVIPTFLVPLWTLLHIASLMKLRREASRASRGNAAARSA
jgi:hypothetical protein